MLNTILKRDNSIVKFDENKIIVAISKANATISKKNQLTFNDILEIVGDICQKASQSKESKPTLDVLYDITVEEIQDIVEDSLLQKNQEVAKAYIRYRETQKNKRNARINLMDTYEQIFFGDAKDSDLRRDNANINTDAPMGKMLKLGAEGAKYFADHYVISEKYVKADREGWIHIHDKDFSNITFNCCQIDLGKLLKNGFSTGHGFLREPNSIRSAASLACIAIQANQNDMFGGQSINAIDYALAPYVAKSFRKHLANIILYTRELNRSKELDNIDDIKKWIIDNDIHYIEDETSILIDLYCETIFKYAYGQDYLTDDEDIRKGYWIYEQAP